MQPHKADPPLSFPSLTVKLSTSPSPAPLLPLSTSPLYVDDVAVGRDTSPLDADDVTVEGAAHVLKVAEDEGALDVKATRDDVLAVLNGSNRVDRGGEGGGGKGRETMVE